MREEKRLIEGKISLLLKIFQILLIVIGSMSLVRLIEEDYIQFFIDLGNSIVILIAYYRLRTYPEHYKLIVRIVFFIAVLTAISLLIYQKENPIRFMWLSTTVYMVFYLFNRKEASLWIIGITAGLFSLLVIDFNIFNIDFRDFLIWILNMLIVLMISYWYTQIEEESTKKLLLAKELLSKEVEKKTRELAYKNMQLLSLNQTLEEKIQRKIEAIRQQEKMIFRQARYAQMGEMISMIAHQWRQPLNTISVSNTTIQIKLRMQEYDHDFLDTRTQIIEHSVQHLSETIDTFRNFFKQDRVKTAQDISMIAKNALSLVKSTLVSKGIAVKTDFHCRCRIETYPNEIIHVLLNLIKNAEEALIERAIEHPTITIKTQEHQNNAVISIEDNAGGIDKSILKSIFDPYFTTKADSNGTGLGLYMSKIIIEDHCQGNIAVSNDSSGVTFQLIFPLSPPPSQS